MPITHRDIFHSSSHEKLEKKLDMLISEVRAGKREGSVVSTKSFGTAAKNNKETWDALRRELEDIGISPEIINEKKHFIVAWFQEAVAAGRLEEEAPSEEDDDSIAHSGSWSSAGNSDRNSVINQERPSPAFGREISKRSSCEVNNLDLPPVTISSQSAIQSPITEAEPEIENSDKSTKARKPSKGDKSSRLSVSYLLSKLRSKGGQLVEAAASGYVDRVRALLDGGAEIEAREKRGATALITAAEHGHSQIIQLLLDKGANVNATSNSGWTALSAASKRDETIDIVQMLLDKNADINVMGSGDPLRVAAARGSVAVLQLLIDRGANIESRDNYGDTALHWAARSGRERSVKLLIENGAAIEATNSDGDTALILAIINGHGNLVKLLLDKEANVEAIAKCGKTPLSHATLHNRADIARLLLVYGAKIDIQDIYGQTPLHIAAVFDRAGVARLLLEYGAKTDIQDEYGRTPLQLAEKRGSMAVVWVLRAVEKHRFDSA